MKTRTVIYADEGMILTNGEIYGKQIFLEEGLDASTFHEITEEEYFESLPEEEQKVIEEYEEMKAKEEEEKTTQEEAVETEDINQNEMEG